jgi:hypothetical protein
MFTFAMIINQKLIGKGSTMKFIKLHFTLLVLTLLSCNTLMAFPSQSGTCNTSGVPTAGMPGRTVQSGTNSDVAFSLYPLMITPGQTHQLTITRTNGSGGFRGLLLYAQNGSGDRIGIFDISDPSMALQYFVCGGSPSSTVTHTSSSTLASTFSINWTAPTNYIGNVTFSAIVYDSALAIPVFNIPTPITAALVPNPVPMINSWSVLILLALLITFTFRKKFKL